MMITKFFMVLYGCKILLSLGLVSSDEIFVLAAIIAVDIVIGMFLNK